MGHVSTPTNSNCNKRCRFHPTESERIRLWDGRTYCRRCVADHSEILTEHAARKGRLCDTVTFADSILWWQYLACCVLAFGSVLTITFLFLRKVFDEAVLLSGFFATMMFAIHVAATGMQRPQTIRIKDGKVYCRTPLSKREYSLSECTWALDSRMEDAIWYPVSRLLPKSEAIRLCAGTGQDRVYAFCCADSATRELWLAFLTFAAERYRTEVTGSVVESR